MEILSLNDYQIEINNIAVAKKFNMETPALMWKLLTEVGEFSKAVEEEKSREDIGLEGADIIIVLLQLLEKYNIDPDMSLRKKIKEVWENPKKTWDGKKIVMQ